MRILLVTHFYPAHGGGVEHVAAQLAARMAQSGHEVAWCASDTDEPPVLEGVACEPMATFNGIERLTRFPYPLWGAASLRRLAQRVRWADAVHVHDCVYFGSLAAAWLARRHRKKLAVTQHIGPVPLPRPLQPLLEIANRVGAHAVLRRADGVAFISPAVRRYFQSLVGASPRFHDVPNGVDPGCFHPDAGARAQRSQLGFRTDRPLMLFVGRFVPKKRLPMIRAMAALRPGWQWCLIGQGPENPRAWQLPNTRVLDPLPQRELAAYYRAADLLVLPSHGEGFPLVVQEAMACGLPACMTAEVASGGAVPRELWLELPEAGAGTAAHGVAAIEAWLAAPHVVREAQREACMRHAAQAWRWDEAVRSHLRWMMQAAP